MAYRRMKRLRYAKSPFGARFTWSSFFNIFWIDILKFQKILKKILDVDIDVLHSSTNLQSKIVFTLTYTKMTNSIRSENLNLTLFNDSDQEICHFYTAQNIKYFALVFCTLVELVIFYNYIFLHNFLKHKYINFVFFKKRAPWSLSSKTLHSTFFHFHNIDLYK